MKKKVGNKKTIKAAKPMTDTQYQSKLKSIGEFMGSILKDSNTARAKDLQKDLTKIMAGTPKEGKVRPPPTKVSSSTKQPKLASTVTAYTAILPGYGTEISAKTDAQQLMRPNAIAYRSVMFPSPTSFNIELVVAKAEPVQLKDTHPTVPWGVELQLLLTGETANKINWISRFESKFRTFTNTAIVKKLK